MPKRERKRYSRPRKLYDKAIIQEENNLIDKYGLKSRREVWKSNHAVERIRKIAKELITASEKEQKEFVERQKSKGFNVESIADVLALNKEDYLKRRLQSIVVKKGFATTPKQARQFITHKHVRLDGKINNTPSHLTTLKEENTVSLDIKLPEKKFSEEDMRILKKIKGEHHQEVE